MPQQTCTEHIPGEEPRTWDEEIPDSEAPPGDAQPEPQQPDGLVPVYVDQAALDTAGTRINAAKDLTSLKAAMLAALDAIKPAED